VLDANQSAAVTHGEGPALVLAGPGSGKTRVIVERTVRLIDEEQARPEQLLVLTFSRKAAADLRERIASRFQRSYASFPITTFHAFCFAVLTRDAAAPPLLARPAERRALMQAALEAEQNLGLRPTRALLEEAMRFAELCDDYLRIPEHDFARVRERYVAALGARGAVDYGGLQREAVALLEQDAEARRTYQSAFRFILVDEYQDTNVAQERLLELLAGERRNVFCVADEDQSIYGFRGAEIDNALRFEERWPNMRRYDLPVNYRSAATIVGLATSVIRRNVDTHLGKELRAAHDRPAEIVGRTFRHAAEEADWIAREIAALRQEGVQLGQVAVLARSLKEIGPRLAYTLRTHGIAFHAPLAPQLHSGADALLSLLELANAYPWEPTHDDAALRVLASPLFGADPLELRRFRRQPRTLYGALREAGDFDAFFQALGIIKRQRTAGGAIYALWERLEHFRALESPGAKREQIEELAAVTALSDAANEFEGEPAEFPRSFREGELELEDWLPSAPPPPDAVALLTVHQAKGLEWDAVFVCELVEGRFPALARSRYALFDRGTFGGSHADEAARARRALEEERRLFYVAMTRARTRLMLTATEEAREESGRSLSRFYLEAQSFLERGRERTEPVSSAEALAALRRAGGGPAGWRDRLQTTNPNAMLPSAGLRTSASRLAPYENCPLQFFYGSLVEIGGTRTTSMRLGGAFHDVLEAFHDPERNEPQTLERLLELAREQSFEEVKPRPLAAEQRRLLERLLQSYFASEVAPGLDAEVLAVEQRFQFELDTSTLTGFIDRIDRLPDAHLRLIDYKTSKSAMKKDEAEKDLQLALYALACRDVPELSALGEVAELIYMYPRHLTRGRIARRAQTMTPDLPERTRQRVRDLVGAIASEQFEFSPTADCTWCDFRKICPRHHLQDAPL
jgi:superfamily I DNA/RNA helicase/RecB family exonuclease